MTTDLTGGLDISSEFVLEKKPEVAETRDAVNVWLESTDGAFGMRIGIEAVAEEWDAHDLWLDIAFANGRVISARQTGKPHPALDEQGQATIRGTGPLRFQCIKPFHHWRATFNGSVPETTAQELIDENWPDQPPMVDVEFNIDMYMAAPPWVPGSMLAEAKEILSGEQGSFVSPRYEQLFRAEGSMRVGDAQFNVKANGLRIRRQGVRKFEGFWGHCWQSAVFPSGKAFGFNTFPPRDDGKPNYNEGYVFDGSGKLKPARAVNVPWITELHSSGDDVSFTLETEDGMIEVSGETFINTRSRSGTTLPPDFPIDFPIVQQAHARYRWDEETTTGMVERSAMKNKMKLR